MRWLGYIFILFSVINLNAQINQDSLLAIWNNKSVQDTSRLIALEKISKDIFMFTDPDSSYYYSQIQLNFAKQKGLKKHISTALYTIGVSKYFVSEYDSALFYFNQSLIIDQKTNSKQGVANNLNNIALVYKEKGDFTLAIKYNLQSLAIKREIGDLKGEASSFNNIGQIYQDKGDMALAIKNYTRSLQLKEELKDKPGMAKTLNNIGSLYYLQKEAKKALEYYSKSILIYEEVNEQYGVAGVLQNIGNLYDDNLDFDKALEYHFKSLKIKVNIGDKNGIANSYNNIGFVFKNKKDYNKALEYFNKSVELKKEMGDKQGLSSTYNNIGDVYRELTHYKKSLEFSSLALNLAKEIEGVGEILDASNVLYLSYKSLGMNSQALEMYELYVGMKDSLEREENQKELIRQEYKYSYEKKAAADSVSYAKEKQIKTAEIEKQKAQLKAKRNQQYGLYGGLLLVLVFAVFMYNRFKVTQKQKSLIEEQKELVEKAHKETQKQKEAVEEVHQEIKDSINYAKRIQSAILPSLKLVKNYLPHSFVLYKPKDVVSGDFYWLEHKDNYILFAAADCTGHGVPGAMVSVVCNNALNRSVREYGLTNPAEILNKTREIVVQEFEKSDDDVKDGMDISLCSLDFNNQSLKWCGANNPLWVVRNQELMEFKPNKQPIGKADNLQPFTTHTIELQKGDAIYVFTDGFADQFGGPKGKKFMYKPFKELLLSIQDKTMDEQKIMLEKHFEDWKGSLEQVDDVCVIGIRV
ncbi:MAG: tetratricopeptide repeat protein [Flavobacteriales bacterium]|nr:tetratricopeptide repeat protein [Flavobacteriales bacterium]MCW8914156.1 tetratricopeptide repeat protein [Flavobacteriales bacterium]MCW8938297.1 tetratricopeptide repeat protein [Flavobacteriales bacterium]MCW8991348.1 tetratricopeptide repeat protein [Flavobacteriales bacterium]MCW9020752.1 tetratricopeptide repeat protein [Flavobacteriales bacterium]